MIAPIAALIGAGAIAPFHVAALREVGFVVKHVASSPGSQRVEQFAREHKIPHAWSNPRELLATDDWDAVVLASSTESIPPLLRLAAETGRPCLVEKPIAFNGNEILEFVQHDSLIRVAYNRRFYSGTTAAKQFAENGTSVFRMELPDSILQTGAPFSGLRTVRENSVHGLDLLHYVVGPFQIERRLDVADPRARVAAVSTQRGHVGTIVLNWNCPANFSLVLDCAPRRFEMRPFEMGSLYEGMEVLEPTEEVPIRRYVPKVVQQVSSFPGSDGLKPGFREQAQSLLQCVQSGNWDERSATLSDAAFAADVAKYLTSD